MFAEQLLDFLTFSVCFLVKSIYNVFFVVALQILTSYKGFRKADFVSSY